MANRNHYLQLFIIFAVAIGTASLYWSQRVPEATYDKKVNFRYGFDITNTTNEFIANSAFNVFAPLEITGAQKVASIRANKEFTIVKDANGNRQLAFNIANLPPYGTTTVKVTVEMQLASNPNEESISRDLHLKDEKFIELGSPLLGQTLDFIKKRGEQKESNLSESIYKWQVENIEYAGYIAEDKGATYALKYLKGDCTEYMYSYVALSRLAGIPARNVAGFILYEDNTLLSSADYHNWGEFYTDNRWQIADAQRQKFINTDAPYVAFRYLGDADQTTVSTSQRFMSFDSRLSVRMD